MSSEEMEHTGNYIILNIILNILIWSHTPSQLIAFSVFNPAYRSHWLDLSIPYDIQLTLTLPDSTVSLSSVPFHRGAYAISEEVIARNLNIAVVGIPKVRVCVWVWECLCVFVCSLRPPFLFPYSALTIIRLILFPLFSPLLTLSSSAFSSYH